jgi:hypothetical protein
MFERAACNLLRRDAVRRLLNNRIVVVDHPIDPAPRRHTANAHIAALLNRQCEAFRASIAGMTAALHIAETIAPEFWANEWFPPVDAIALFSFIARQRPRTYFEIGSGYSTIAARHAANVLRLGMRIISVDPMPRAEIDALCDTIIRSPFEKVMSEVYGVVESGDVIFIDNSHYCFQGSDATTAFLDFLPSLPPGVLVGIHDVFLPFDYPEVWRRRFYNEQYLLATYLLGLGDRARVELPAFLVTNDNAYSTDFATVRSFLDGCRARFQGCAFWFVSRNS